MCVSADNQAVSGLSELSVESRVFPTPWIRMLRGIGLGQYPVDYDLEVADSVTSAFELLVDVVSVSDGYTRFCQKIAAFVLQAGRPGDGFVADRNRVFELVDSMREIVNPYYKAMAGSILIDAFVKLDLEVDLLVGDGIDIVAELLDVLEDIGADQIADENQGRHGGYEKIFASSAVFLAIGNLGFRERLVTPRRDYIVESLDLLDSVPIPYFRGRVAGALMSTIAVLGYSDRVFDHGTDYMHDVLNFLREADAVGNWPEFHNPITTEWKKVYPLLTMLNAVALCGRPEYLREPFDLLADARNLLGTIPWEIRVHMLQYYVVALHNLGILESEIPDLHQCVGEAIAVAASIDPGENYSPRGNAYPYILELAMMTGSLDLVPEGTVERMVDSFPDLTSSVDRQNRPFPVSYVLNIVAELGRVDLMFGARDRYHGKSPMHWVIANLSEGAEHEGDRVSMIDNALVGLALRMRGAGATEKGLFRSFVFTADV